MRTQKIKSMVSVGKMPVYDLEVPDSQNFVLENGSIVHNCAYGRTGYITMYLKHHYPLEWWTAVLNTTNDKSGKDSEEKIRYYMQLVGDLVQSPSLANPSANFQIVGDKIIAPMSVLKGVGAKAVSELADKGPFVSIEDFVARAPHNKVNFGTFSAMIKGRALDCFIDSSDYENSRLELLNTYRKLRKSKEFSPELMDGTPINVFLMEQEANKCFNKSLLSDERVVNFILRCNPEISRSNSKAVPLSFNGKTPILSGIRVADLLCKEGHSKSIGLILMYCESSHKVINSKKSGKQYDLVQVKGADGCFEIEFALWNQNKPLRWNKNSLFLVRGTLEEGYKSKTTIRVEDIQPLRMKEQ